ncbi:hypothetical protein HYPSUDRAFT_207433 [Hypholoma sublateritium FD-334 SS-4]|uniref:Uncharacterized protein n=1 Tax=Hypholoma sublateritium (strain FD-334 SS-4) TaxID=945553 RepID=A0A0D2LYG9_HYPSF|nr:hypothetical protein HYPSUDRAFT_207433 [Hypholoma sublateritium FD-334 SS-4]
MTAATVPARASQLSQVLFFDIAPPLSPRLVVHQCRHDAWESTVACTGFVRSKVGLRTPTIERWRLLPTPLASINAATAHARITSSAGAVPRLSVYAALENATVAPAGASTPAAGPLASAGAIGLTLPPFFAPLEPITTAIISFNATSITRIRIHDPTTLELCGERPLCDNESVLSNRFEVPHLSLLEVVDINKAPPYGVTAHNVGVRKRWGRSTHYLLEARIAGAGAIPIYHLKDWEAPTSSTTILDTPAGAFPRRAAPAQAVTLARVPFPVAPPLSPEHHRPSPALELERTSFQPSPTPPLSNSPPIPSSVQRPSRRQHHPPHATHRTALRKLQCSRRCFFLIPPTASAAAPLNDSANVPVRMPTHLSPALRGVHKLFSSPGDAHGNHDPRTALFFDTRNCSRLNNSLRSARDLHK